MSKYRSYNWPQLFAEFEQSGLFQKAFCSQHQINPSYFGIKLAKRKAREAGAFAQVVVAPESRLLQKDVLLAYFCNREHPILRSVNTCTAPSCRSSNLT